MKIIKEKNPVNEAFKVNFFVKLFASVFFAGYTPVAPGTAGSFVAFLIFLIPGFSNFYILTSSLVVIFIFGVYASEIMQKRYGHDARQIVIDEVAGLWFTYFIGYVILAVFIPFKSFNPEATIWTKIDFGLTGFIIFRIFDIMKIQPGKYFEEKDTGWGVMMDDIVAAFYAGILSAVLSHLLWYRFFVKFT